MRLLLVFLMLTTQIAFAAGDAARGEKLYKKCSSCHGTDGMGKKSQSAPMLAGQFDWYIVSQVNAIKTGKRANKNSKKMLPFVKKLNDTDINDLAAYISSMPKKQ